MNRIAAFTLVAVSALSSSSFATILGTSTITNADHYGYFGFASTSQYNTKGTIGGFAGTTRVIHVEGDITDVSDQAWVASIQVNPTGGNLATYQPAFQFSRQLKWTGTVHVSADIFAPGGFNAAKPINVEMYSLDSEQYVPGLDARSTLTYTFDDSFAPGTVSYSGALTSRSPTFHRPIQGETINGLGQPGYTAPQATTANSFYSVQAFHVDTAGSYSMVSANEFRSANALYQNSFDPANPLVNCLQAHDESSNILRNTTLANLTYLGDATGGTMTIANLVPGVNYYFVTTAFDAPGTVVDPVMGNFQNIITGAGNVTLGALVPEPTTLSLGAAALLIAGRRRRL